MSNSITMVVDGERHDMPAALVAATPPSYDPVPPVISRFQGRYVLRRMPGTAEGQTMLDAVGAKMAQMGGEAAEAWEDITEFRRDSDLVNQIGTMFALDLDDLFRKGAQVLP